MNTSKDEDFFGFDQHPGDEAFFCPPPEPNDVLRLGEDALFDIIEPFVPETIVDRALDSSVYRELYLVTQLANSVVAAIQDLINVIPATREFQNPEFLGSGWEDEDYLKKYARLESTLATANLERLKRHLAVWFEDNWAACDWARNQWLTKRDASRLIEISNPHSNFHARAASCGTRIAAVTAGLLSFIQENFSARWTAGWIQFGTLEDKLNRCHAEISSLKITSKLLGRFSRGISTENRRATEYLIKNRWLLLEFDQDVIDTRKAKGESSLEFDDLFEAKEMAAAVHLEDSSIGPFKKAWIRPKLESRGRKAAQFSYRENLEILRRQFQAFEFPETLTEARSSNGLKFKLKIV